MKHILPFIALAAIAAPASAKTITVSPGPDAQEKLQGAMIEAVPGDVIQIAAGRFDLTDGLSLDVDKVTVRGAGKDKTVLSFKGQMGAGEGLLVTSDDVVLRGFAVEDSKGDGIKSKGANRIVYREVRVEWTGGPKETNGAYGLYPVESRDVLIDGCLVKGASDAGIYVGQSENIIVRHNNVMGNVAGIEIENSRHADVFENSVAHNTGGILVFDLPNLPRKGGGDVRVFRNAVAENDQPNFAPKGNIVASVRRGTGVLIMANDNVHVFENAFARNATSDVMVISYRFPYTDAAYNPLPRSIVVRDNAHGGSGTDPQLPGGAALVAAFGGAIPPVIWDGSGGDALGIVVRDKVPVLSMGLATGAAQETAKPVMVDLSKGKVAVEPKAVVLPASMETAAK